MTRLVGYLRWRGRKFGCFLGGHTIGDWMLVWWSGFPIQPHGMYLSSCRRCGVVADTEWAGV